MPSMRPVLFIVPLLLAGAIPPAVAAKPAKPAKDLLPRAVADGQVDEVKRLLEAGADPNARNAGGLPPLHQLVWAAPPASHAQVFRLLLDRGAKLNAKDAESQTVFMRALARAARPEPDLLATAKLLAASAAEVNGKYKDGRSTLHLAIELGDADLVRAMLERRSDTRAKDRGGATPLMQAILQKKGDLALLLLKNRADLGGETDGGRDALMLAAELAEPPVLQEMLARGADAARRDGQDRTALMYAVKRSDPAIVRILLEKGADTERRDARKHTALMQALLAGDKAVSLELLRGGADISGLGDTKETTLMMAVRHCDAAVVKTAMERKPDTKAKDADGRTAVMWALLNNRIDAAKELVRGGAELGGSEKGRTTLMLAVERGDPELAGLMLEKKADSGARDEAGRTALMQALLGSKGEIALELARRGADQGGTYQEGLTPLMLAVQHGDLEIVRALLAKGADVNRKDARGRTALVHAISLKKNDIAKELIRGGTRTAGTEESGWTPLMHAVVNGDADLVGLVLASGKEIDAKEKTLGLTALMLAARDGRVDLVKALLLHGADMKIKNRKKQTAALMAEVQGQGDIVRLLVRYQEGLEKPKRGSTPSSPSVDKDEMQRMMDEAIRKATVSKVEDKAPVQVSYSTEVDRPAYAVPEDPDQLAIVAGVEKYSDLPDAQFAERDAEAVREHLRGLGVPERNIVFLTGAKATKTGLLKHIETWLPRNANEKSTVFFYYSGHGAPDPVSGQAYLLPSDGDPKYLAETAYPVKRLYDTLNGLKVRRVIVALDSCFSGAGGRSVLAPGTRPLVSKLELGVAGTGKTVTFSASQSDEISGTAPDQGHGLFTYYLLKGLNGAAKDADGKVTVKSLYDFLLPNVKDRARRDNREQTPQMTIGSETGEDLLLRP
ncbi:MAG: ankyrin repeat domain-containing protein [Elusimicrobia bacterium]|nr:ankyrin repeat domain-containing protein [Elusimicrobiota bacterium]